jgi:alpha-tubulin suppressor-like RCC1 family protein
MAEVRRNQLYTLLNDPSLYSSFLPKDIKDLVLDYLSISVYVLGRNSNNQLGFESKEKMISTPIHIASNIIDVAFGTNISLALTNTGDLLISGNNIYGSFGLTNNEKQIILSLDSRKYDIEKNVSTSYINLSVLKQFPFKVTKIACMCDTSFIITDSGSCYGINFGYEKIPMVLLFENIQEIVTGDGHCLFLSNDGRLFEYNLYGYLNVKYNKIVNKKLKLHEIIGFPKISKIFSSYGNYGFISDGYLYIGGINKSNKLASTPSKIIDEPMLVIDQSDQPIINVQKVDFGSDHMCILTDLGLFGRGDNQDGQLGQGSERHINELRLLIENKKDKVVEDIAADSKMSLIVINKIVYSTGNNYFGQLGLGDLEHRDKFTPLPMFTPSFVQSIKQTKVIADAGNSAIIIYS